ncbi:hypothetical protein IPH92_04105 [Candidatus Kaiserbacteria bacterium]|nr:MAG: hypothetical protein IPH92_04105 [Candidatus Kaiserbacteria bacterium]
MENELQQKRIGAYRAASQLIKDQYGNMVLGGILKSISQNNSLSKEKHGDFVNLIGDYILGIYSKDVVEEKLVSQIGIASNETKSVLSVITNFLTGKENAPEVPEAPKDFKEKLELRPEDAQVSESDGKGSVRPLTRDEVLRALAPARTMAGDIASLGKPSDTPRVPPTAKP